MLQEDSNGETTFEIIDKKMEELSTAGEKTESLSSMSSSTSLLPSPGVSVANVPSMAGNLLSNVQPPSALPNFITSPVLQPMAGAFVPSATMQSTAPIQNPAMYSMPPQPPVVASMPYSTPVNIQQSEDAYHPTQFSAAIPPSKGVPQGSVPLKEASPTHDSGGFIGWMKGAVGSGGILSKVAEKAKNSVDSMITTLDPQMREIIYSGGDVDIIVASSQEVKISAIREAFQSVFGKATVGGLAVQSTNIAAQPVGFAAGIKAAEERIQGVLKHTVQQPLPVVAVENFLLEVGEDKWFDLGVLILNDPTKQINLQVFTQMTPVPASIVALAQEDTPNDYPLKWSGYSVTIGSLMAQNLQVNHKEWHHALTGVSRRDIILLAAKTLANMYKNSLG